MSQLLLDKVTVGQSMHIVVGGWVHMRERFPMLPDWAAAIAQAIAILLMHIALRFAVM
jgi:hypothetical protein